MSNNHLEGGWALCRCSLSGKEVVELSFGREGSCEDSVEEVEVEMVAKEKSPWWVALGDERLERFLNRRKWEEASSGWYYSQCKRAVCIKYPNPKRDARLRMSFEQFDLTGM